jgi:hypothetical protein
MNKGLKKATGDYVWFLNAGDLLYSSNVVEEIVCKIKDANILPDIIYGETEIIDKEGISLGMRRLKVPKRLSLNSFKMGMLVCHQSFIVKRALSPEYDTKYRFSADFDWCIRCLKKASYILNIHLIISSFLDEGMTSINRKESLKERYIIMCKYYGKISTNILHVWFAIRFYSFKLKNNRV